MAVCTDQPPQGFVGTFLVGDRVVGARYLDATCGTPTCGYAVSGMWWAYLCPAPLRLLGTLPDAVLLGEEVSAARLTITARAPQLQIDDFPLALQAGLHIEAYAPSVSISSSLATPAAELDLGGVLPDFVGQVWLFDTSCIDMALPFAPSSDLVLVGAGVTTIDLEAEVCR